MRNFILGIILSISFIAINQEFDEEGLDLFIKKYQEKQKSIQNDEGLGEFLADKIKEYSKDDTIKYEDYAD